MTMDIRGKTAVVTGSTKGIGNGIARAYAQAGADVVIVSRHQEDCDRAAAELREKYGARTLAVAGDVTKRGDIENIMNKTVEAFGRIDILLNNAGSAITKRAEDLTEADWDRVVDLDLKAVFFCAQAAGRVMIKQKRGKIINISSILGIVADKQVLPYAVAKGGVLQMTKALALEWAKHNIQVNAICPGYVKTEMNAADLESDKIGSHLLGKIAMRRFGEVDEIAGAAIFLASEASNYMTGQQIVIDGGWCAE